MKKSHRAQKQNGNMFIGLVLGLMTGLAIAIAVALYVTRSPSPVAPKSPTPESPDPLNGSPVLNPNLPLQGRHPAEPIPGSSDSMLSGAVLEQTQDPTQDVSQVPLDEAQIIEVPSERVPEANKPSIALSRSSTEVPEAPVVDANTGYYLQAGAYKTRADAEAQRAQLALQGVEAKVSRHQSGNMTYYRVRIGPLTQFNQMNSMRQQLSEAGIGTVVIRFHKGQTQE